jgi:tetratricopeptide (TPR) repeat protein
VAEQHKAKGNAEFQAGNLEAAKKEYDEALLNLGHRTVSASNFGVGLPSADANAAAAIEAAGPELAARAKACRIPSQLNLALCCLRSTPCEASRALELCETVLDQEPENAKAIYRKAKALIELEIFDEAEWELTRAYKLLPKDASVRQDLQKLRRRIKEEKEAEKKTFEGVFQKGAGFASDGRESEVVASGDATRMNDRRGSKYSLMKAAEDNPYMDSTQPAEEALKLRTNGQLEEAIWAFEAALMANTGGDAEVLCRQWLELGRLYMDLNIDAIALSCIAEAIESQEGSTRQHAILLSAICLLNEAESDVDKEVSRALAYWLSLARPASDAPTIANLDEQLRQWRGSGKAGVDAAVAHGVMHLARGQMDEALQDFVAVLHAPEDESHCFGIPRCQATKWNMIGAVLANRKREKDSLVAYEWALRLQPHYPRALFNQGIALQALSRPLEAARSFAQVLRITPSWAADMVWPGLAKASDDCDRAVCSDVDHAGLAEAGKERNFAKVNSILGPYIFSTATSSTLHETMDQLGLPLRQPSS